ncbi:MAG: glycosyltransferase family 2 protein [Planctomycetes bacterium]|nr:glycosyltransferase family 2 protein [Planctomycetota bacterium]
MTAAAPQPLASAPASTRGVPPVSVVILTLNEEMNIAECIRSCAWWCDDIHLLDSGSTDRTRDIAAAMGVTVHVHPFTSFGQQRNWAIDNIPCRHRWHFHLDADERFTPELVAEMVKQIGPDGTKSPHGAYLVPNKIIFLGKWLKYSGGYPAYQVRLFRPEVCRFIDFGHGQREHCEGTVARLDQPYIHLSFSKGLVEWFSKHNQYSTRESDEGILVRAGPRPTPSQFFGSDPVVRRRAFKNLSFFLRGRSLWRFLYNYVYRLGFLDGAVGFHYCAMMAMYEYWIEIKIREHEAEWVGKTDALSERLGAEVVR